MRPFRQPPVSNRAPISTPFIAAGQADQYVGRSAEVFNNDPARKCSSICGILRAQNVTDLTRRVLLSPSLMMVAFGDARHIDSAGLKSRSKLHGTAPRTGGRADSCSLAGSIFDHLRFGRSSKSPLNRASTALFINRRIQFVDDNAGDVGVFRAASCCAISSIQLVQLFWRVRYPET